MANSEINDFNDFLSIQQQIRAQIMNTSILCLKGEVARYKRKCKESSAESAKLRKDLDDMKTAEIKALQVS